MMKTRKTDKQNLTDSDFLDQDYVEFSEPAPQSLTLTEDSLRSPTELQRPYGASNYHPTHNGGASNYPETNKTGDNTVISITPYTTPRYTEGVGYRIRNCFLTILQPDGTDDYLPWSIINTLYCCVVFGLMALIFSVKSKSAREQGDKKSARWHSVSAYRLNILATLLGFIIVVTFYILYCATDLLDHKDGYLFNLPKRLKGSAAKN